MTNVIFFTTLFSIFTVVSILLLGNRALISGDMTVLRIISLIFSWQFMLGAFFAFAARLSFVLINNALLKIPELAPSSTTITTLITTVAIVFVIIANYFFLNEKITTQQMIGALVIFIGIFLVSK